MKRFLSLSFSIALMLFSLLQPIHAQDKIQFHVNIDDISRVAVFVDEAGSYVECTTLQNGLNDIDVVPASYIKIEAKAGCRLVSVIDNPGGSWEYDRTNQIVDQKSIEFTYYSDYGDVTYVTSAKNEDVRTAKCFIKIDDITKVVVKYGKSNEIIALQNGDNDLLFDPATETELIITPSDDNIKPLYKVTVDGKDAAYSGYRHTAVIQDGCVVDIQANFPNIDYPVHLLLEGDEAEEFIRQADVDDKPVFNFKDENFTVPAGGILKLVPDLNEWEVLECTINGIAVAMPNPFTILIEQETTIRVKVRKIGSYKVVIDIDDPAAITLYDQYKVNNKIVELQAGENTVNLKRIPGTAGGFVQIVTNEGYYLESAHYSDSEEYEFSREELNENPLQIGLIDFTVVTIRTGKIARNKQAMLYISGFNEQLQVQRANHSALPDLHEGYNLFQWFEYDNPFTIVCRDIEGNKTLYWNGEPVEANYWGNFEDLQIQENDVLKLFLGELPASRKVNITLSEGIADKLSIKCDLVQEISLPASELIVFDGTQISIEPKEGWQIEVTLNGEKLTDKDGQFVVVISADSQLDIKGINTGIENIVNAININSPVYNLQGNMVLRQADKQSLSTLPQGVYIVDGKKFIKE